MNVPSPVRRGPFDHLSIEQKLPLIMCGLLLASILALAGAAYIEMGRTSQVIAGARLTTGANQMRTMLEASGVQLRAVTAAVARKPEIVALGKSRDSATLARATEALRPRTPNEQASMRAELRDLDKGLLAAVGPAIASDTTTVMDILTPAAATDSAVVGRLRVLRDTIVYPVAARVPGTERLFVVHWRRVTRSARATGAVARLIGSGATVLMGNLEGDQWTDLDKPVAGPSAAAGALREPAQYQREGNSYLISAVPITGTPWQVGVEFPLGAVRGPVNDFMQRIILIGLVALGLGLIVTRRMSRLLNTTMVQLRDAQETLVRREKLAILGQLAGGVGHELRNPLGVMTNAVYYLKVVLAESPQTVKEYLEILQQQITLSEKIVGDLLDFARQKPPQRRLISIDTLTQAQIARLGHTNGIKVDVDVPQDLPQVFVDEVQIGQIVLNLLTNAVQAMDGKGILTVRARETAGRIEYAVTDTGPGVAAENVEKIFEPLFTTKARGIGLGLAVSRSLARANDGDLSLAAPPNGGASLVLTLPAAAGAAP